ncbi:NAD-dependent epimerase/dehydratase family protein, partial [bacterium]|nr:NAD-dependent epimerase/dehydratase family protein [bacterium]
MQNHILVTGANGFIGKRLVQILSERGHSVCRCTRNYSEYSDIAVGEIGPDTDWKDAVDGVSTVIHLAGRAHVLNETVIDPLVEFRRTNVEGTLTLAQHSVHARVKRFIYISSIGVNGVQSSRPFMDSDTPHPIEPYAISKYEAECGLRQIAKSSDMDVVIIRPPLVYGANAPGNFGRLMRVAYKGVPLPLGAVHNKRSLVALDNLVDFIVTCVGHPAAANQTFLISDGEDISTTELLQRLRLSLRVPIRLFPIPVGILSVMAN